MELEHPKARQLTVVGSQFIEFLLASEEVSGNSMLEEVSFIICMCMDLVEIEMLRF